MTTLVAAHLHQPPPGMAGLLRNKVSIQTHHLELDGDDYLLIQTKTRDVDPPGTIFRVHMSNVTLIMAPERPTTPEEAKITRELEAKRKKK